MTNLRGAFKIGLAIAAAAALAGCQNKGPMEYLPKSSGGYMGVNISKMKESDGLKRVGDELGNLQGGASNFKSEKAKRIYIAFDSPDGAAAPAMYGVAVGDEGFADEVVKEYVNSGAAKTKKAGMDAYTSGPATISPVGSTGILVYQDEASLNKMLDVSKKKAEGARGSAEFNFVDGQLNDHAMAVATKAEPLLTLAGPMLGQLEAMNADGAKALKDVSMLSVTFNWDKEPVTEVQMHLADKAKSEQLKGLVDQGVAMLNLVPMISASAEAQELLKNLKTNAAEDGVKITLTVPAALADKMLEQMDKGAAMGQGAFGGAPTGAMPPPE